MAHTNFPFYPIMDLWTPNVNPPYLTFSVGPTLPRCEAYGPFDFGSALGEGYWAAQRHKILAPHPSRAGGLGKAKVSLARVMGILQPIIKGGTG